MTQLIVSAAWWAVTLYGVWRRRPTAKAAPGAPTARN